MIPPGQTLTVSFGQNVPGAETIDAEGVEVSRLEHLQHSPDASLQVGNYTRQVARTEAESGGLFTEMLDAYMHAGAWPTFVREAFASLFGTDAINQTAAPGTEWIAKVLEQARELPEWKRLARHARGEAWVSGHAAAKIGDALSTVLNDVLHDAPETDPASAAQDVETATCEHADAEQELQDAYDTPALHDEIEVRQQAVADAAQLVEVAQEFQEEANAWAQAAAEVLDVRQQAMRKALRAAMGGVVTELGEVEAALAGFMPGSGTFAGASTTPRQELVSLLRKDARLRRIAQIAGRMKVSMRRVQASKTRHYHDEVYSVENGDDLRRLLPSELALLGDPDTELLLDAKLLERSAAVYAMRGTEKLDRGPIVVLIDASGSMAGGRQEWACGVALTLIELATKQKRPWCVAHYQGEVTHHVSFPKGKTPSVADLIAAVTTATGGGTTLANALRWVNDNQPLGKDADVVVISDGGDDNFGPAMQVLKAKGVRVYGVEIECRFPAEERSEFTEVSGVAMHGDKFGTVDAVLAI